MAYIVVVEHDTKRIVLIPTEITDDPQKAIEQAKSEVRILFPSVFSASSLTVVPHTGVFTVDWTLI